jgi:ubiquinone biosynthesis protein
MKRELTRMGPAYIKMGQFVGSRTDVFPKYITDSLSELHDNVAPVPFEDIQFMLKDLELDVEETPLSSASIGQVYRAKLKSDTKAPPLVVKVQKPKVSEQVHEDLEALTNTVNVLKTLFPENKMVVDMYNIVVQCKRSVYQELDFVRERDNLKALWEAFENTSITIPRVVSQLSSGNILVMEYVESEKLQKNKTDTTEIVREIVSAALKHGVIHGDLHAGNIGDLGDGYVLYDSGSVIYVDPRMINDLFIGIMSQNVNTVVEKLLEYKLVFIDKEPEGREQLNRAVFYVIDYINHMDIKRLIGHIKTDTVLNTKQFYFHIDPDLFLLSRTLSLLEGTCKSVNDQFSYNDVIIDMVMDMDIKILLQRALTDFQRMTRTSVQSTGRPEWTPTQPQNLKTQFEIKDLITIILLLLNLISN